MQGWLKKIFYLTFILICFSANLYAESIFFLEKNDGGYEKISGRYQYAMDYYNSKKMEFYIQNDELFIKNPNKYDGFKLLVVKEDGSNEILTIKIRRKINYTLLSKKENKKRTNIRLNGSYRVEKNKSIYENDLFLNTRYGSNSIYANIYNIKSNNLDKRYYFNYTRQLNTYSNAFFEVGATQNDFNPGGYNSVGAGYNYKVHRFYLGQFLNEYKDLKFIQYKNSNLKLDLYTNQVKNQNDVRITYNNTWNKLSYQTAFDIYNNAEQYNYDIILSQNKGGYFINSYTLGMNQQNIYKNLYEDSYYLLDNTHFYIDVINMLYNNDNKQTLHLDTRYQYDKSGKYIDSSYYNALVYKLNFDKLEYQLSIGFKDQTFDSVGSSIALKLSDQDRLLLSLRVKADYASYQIKNVYLFDKFIYTLAYNNEKYAQSTELDVLTNNLIWNFADYTSLHLTNQLGQFNRKLDYVNNQVELRNRFFLKDSTFTLGYLNKQYKRRNYDESAYYINYSINIGTDYNYVNLIKKKSSKKISFFNDLNYNGIMDGEETLIEMKDINVKFYDNDKELEIIKSSYIREDRSYRYEYYEDYGDSASVKMDNIGIDYKVGSFNENSNNILVPIEQYQKISISMNYNNEVFFDTISYDVICGDNKQTVNQTGYYYDILVKKGQDCSISNMDTSNGNYSYDVKDVTKNDIGYSINVIPKNQFLVFITKNDIKENFNIKINNKKHLIKDLEIIDITKEGSYNVQIMFDKIKYDCQGTADYSNISVKKITPKKYKIDYICSKRKKKNK